MKYIFFLYFAGLSFALNGQHSSAIIFSHNDYLQPEPFHSASKLGVGYVEADVFLRDGRLMVAHTADEIRAEKTLRELYFNPVKEKITAKNRQLDHLTLMIDLKTEGISTLNAIVSELNVYKPLTSSKKITIAISGNVPDTSQWKLFPDYITFDGRPDKKYSPRHLKRVSFISNNFRIYSQWDGEGVIPAADELKLKAVIASVHAQGKKIRFWAAPDVPNAWKKLLQLEVDILGTDRIQEVAAFLKTQ